MPSGSAFYYDNELKKWVKNGETGAAVAVEKLAPPPLSKPMITAAHAAAVGDKVLDTAPSKSGKRNARSKYVDVINPNATSQISTVNTGFMPTFPSMPLEVNVAHFSVSTDNYNVENSHNSLNSTVVNRQKAQVPAQTLRPQGSRIGTFSPQGSRLGAPPADF